jgi:glutathione S-transferase/GST-like protein
VRTSKWSGVPFDDLPHLTRWVELIRARPAVQAGILMPPSQLSGSEDDARKARKFVEEARKMVVTGGPASDRQ